MNSKSETARAWFVLVPLCFYFLAMRDLHARADDEYVGPAELKKRVSKAFAVPKDCKSLHPENRIWINRDEQIVIADGYVAQRQVPLELFACPTGSKEHESIVAIFARAQSVHAGLLAINAKPGSPATFDPFKPATGTTVRIYVLWLDDEGNGKGTLAQNWIRRVGTQKCMYWDFVFAGSKIYKDDDGVEHYLGDSGELISVSNFSTSTMDVAVKSDQANSNLLFEAFTERIPKRDTPIRLVMTLTDEPPFGSVDTGESSDKAKEPKYLSEEIPKNVMLYMPSVPKQAATTKATPTTQPSKDR